MPGDQSLPFVSQKQNSRWNAAENFFPTTSISVSRAGVKSCYILELPSHKRVKGLTNIFSICFLTLWNSFVCASTSLTFASNCISSASIVQNTLINRTNLTYLSYFSMTETSTPMLNSNRLFNSCISVLRSSKDLAGGLGSFLP